MENNKINIAEILKDCPKGTKLYTPIFSKVELVKINEKECYQIHVKDGSGNIQAFTENGLFRTDYSDAECLLFPSSKMRDWSRFFKPGDVVIDSFYGCGVLVEEWADESYTSFEASVFQLKKGGFAKRDKRVISIDGYYKASDEQRDKFIADMEKFFGGKYNPKTRQVEPAKTECEFKAFDKVLVRNNDQQIWKAAFFSYCNTSRDSHNYVTIPGFAYNWCIPYEGNKHLLGTTDPYNEKIAEL